MVEIVAAIAAMVTMAVIVAMVVNGQPPHSIPGVYHPLWW